jgi:hypothetical protein
MGAVAPSGPAGLIRNRGRRLIRNWASGFLVARVYAARGRAGARRTGRAGRSNSATSRGIRSSQRTDPTRLRPFSTRGMAIALMMTTAVGHTVGRRVALQRLAKQEIAVLGGDSQDTCQTARRGATRSFAASSTARCLFVLVTSSAGRNELCHAGLTRGPRQPGTPVRSAATQDTRFARPACWRRSERVRHEKSHTQRPILCRRIAAPPRRMPGMGPLAADGDDGGSMGE